MKKSITTNISRRDGHPLWAIFSLLLLTTLSTGCKKYVEVSSLKDQLLSSQVYGSQQTANAAVTGVYVQAKNSLMYDATVYNSLAADDIVNYPSSVTYNYYRNDQIPSTDNVLPWAQLYATIYAANSVIEGLSGNTNVAVTAENNYIGEAKFLRAYCYFYLVNLFGDVPLVTTTDVNTTMSASRTPADSVYGQIISDLTDAQSVLAADYSYSNGNKTRANKWVAAALLARVYLYRKDWKNAALTASAVINSTEYSLLNGPAGIFTANNNEAILQWARFSGEVNMLPSSFIFSYSPQMICTNTLINAFEPGDFRQTAWIKTTTYNGTFVSYPFKFTTTSTSTTESYTVLRLAEQYLIRAEAEAMQSDIPDAVADINLIRQQHGGLAPLSAAISQGACVDAILHERQVDYFTEEMHRWFDLKRTGRLDSVMAAEKPAQWQPTAALYPIPLTEIQRDNHLIQNPGY